MIREGISEAGALTQSSGNDKKDRGKQTDRGKAAHVRGKRKHQIPEVDGNLGCWGNRRWPLWVELPSKAYGGRKRAGISRGFRSWKAWMAMTFQLQIREF